MNRKYCQFLPRITEEASVDFQRTNAQQENVGYFLDPRYTAIREF